jgi:hypothetical protein
MQRKAKMRKEIEELDRRNNFPKEIKRKDFLSRIE